MKINFDAFIETLPIMGLGMVGIFAVTAVIILAMVALRATSKK